MSISLVALEQLEPKRFDIKEFEGTGIGLTPCKKGKMASDLNKRYKMIENIHTLLDKYPDGIWFTEFLNLYKSEFGADLNVIEYGYESFAEMIHEHGHIFKYTIPKCGLDFKLYSEAKKRSDKSFNIREPFVPTIIKNNIEKLLQIYPQGIPVRGLFKAYEDTYKSKIVLEEYDCASVDGFLNYLNEFADVCTIHGEKFLVEKRNNEYFKSNMTQPNIQFQPPFMHQTSIGCPNNINRTSRRPFFTPPATHNSALPRFLGNYQNPHLIQTFLGPPIVYGPPMYGVPRFPSKIPVGFQPYSASNFEGHNPFLNAAYSTTAADLRQHHWNYTQPNNYTCPAMSPVSNPTNTTTYRSPRSSITTPSLSNFGESSLYRPSSTGLYSNDHSEFEINRFVSATPSDMSSIENYAIEDEQPRGETTRPSGQKISTSSLSGNEFWNLNASEKTSKNFCEFVPIKKQTLSCSTSTEENESPKPIVKLQWDYPGTSSSIYPQIPTVVDDKTSIYPQISAVVDDKISIYPQIPAVVDDKTSIYPQIPAVVKDETNIPAVLDDETNRNGILDNTLVEIGNEMKKYETTGGNVDETLSKLTGFLKISDKNDDKIGESDFLKSEETEWTDLNNLAEEKIQNEIISGISYTSTRMGEENLIPDMKEESQDSSEIFTLKSNPYRVRYLDVYLNGSSSSEDESAADLSTSQKVGSMNKTRISEKLESSADCEVKNQFEILSDPDEMSPDLQKTDFQINQDDLPLSHMTESKAVPDLVNSTNFNRMYNFIKQFEHFEIFSEIISDSLDSGFEIVGDGSVLNQGTCLSKIVCPRLEDLPDLENLPTTSEGMRDGIEKMSIFLAYQIISGDTIRHRKDLIDAALKIIDICTK